jgi:hypothetical protein
MTFTRSRLNCGAAFRILQTIADRHPGARANNAAYGCACERMTDRQAYKRSASCADRTATQRALFTCC